MSCPVFLPTHVSAEPKDRAARLPLIEEYSGLCMAQESYYAPAKEISFRCCNHGYSNGVCPRLPREIDYSCLRYSVLRSTAEMLEVLCVEEANYQPLRWYRLQYRVLQSEIVGAVPSACIQAQALAFCRSYLRRIRPESN